MGVDGKPRIFRLEDHMQRFLSSCERLAFPSFDVKEMGKFIKELIKLDIRFLPKTSDGCLYIRPAAMSDTSTLGVKTADKMKVFVIISPVQGYFSSEIHLGVCETYDRGGPLSANAYKLGANYAPTIQISGKYAEKGISQALWLHNGNILESGATNIFFISKDISQGDYSIHFIFHKAKIIYNFRNLSIGINSQWYLLL